MGQKINPLGFRLGTTQKHKSNWFSKFNNYPQFLKEDLLIRNFFEKMNHIRKISKIEINRNSSGNKIEIVLVTYLPNKLLGKYKKNYLLNINLLYEALSKILSNERFIILKINIIKNPNTDATILSHIIVEQLEKRVAFRRAIKNVIEKAQASKILGIKVQISGRLNGADIARTSWIRRGRVPLQTLRAIIDYSQKQAHTIYGVLGIKVWLFKGEIF